MADMSKRERVARALACCVPLSEEEARLGCRSCPYQGCMVEKSVFMPIRLLEDVRAVLKAQEPRLLTEDDFRRDDADRGDAIPCWKEPKSPTRREGWAVIVYGKWYQDQKAGVARYWTGKPSEQQREAAPWS